jgi:amino acid permease
MKKKIFIFPIIFLFIFGYTYFLEIFFANYLWLFFGIFFYLVFFIIHDFSLKRKDLEKGLVVKDRRNIRINFWK